MKNPVEFLRESSDELKKVHRPTRQETVQTAIWVVMLIILSALFLGFADYLAGSFMRWFLAVS